MVDLARRSVILLLATAGVSVSQTDDLERLFDDRRAAAAIGHAFLSAQAAPWPSLTAVKAEVAHALQLGDTKPLDLAGVSLRARLSHRIREDFVSGDVVVVDGWMLSRVEAQACAIAYLSSIREV